MRTFQNRRQKWLTIGGTSLATPLISGLYGLAGGANGVRYPALTLYGHLGGSSVLYDVTEGGNGFCDDGGLACGINAEVEETSKKRACTADCEGTTACNADDGFDGPSGVGSPNWLALFEPLKPTAAITVPAKLRSGVAGTFGGSLERPIPGRGTAKLSMELGRRNDQQRSGSEPHQRRAGETRSA